MKFQIILTFAVFAAFEAFSKVFVDAKSVQLGEELEIIKNCSDVNVNEECEIAEGRRKKFGHKGQQSVLVVEPHSSDQEYYVEEDYYAGKRGKKRGKGKKKGNKKKHKMFKKIKPMLAVLAGMKLLAYHLLMKKMALATFLSFVLSKISFILASLVALKQFFHTPTHHRSQSDSNKLEVVHIPINHHREHKYKEKDAYYDESQFVPVTFQPETVYDTTPFFNDFPYRGNTPETFTSSEEDFNFNGNFDGKLDDNLNDLYNKHYKNNNNLFANSFDRKDQGTDEVNEKDFYKNHVHSPFV